MRYSFEVKINTFSGFLCWFNYGRAEVVCYQIGDQKYWQTFFSSSIRANKGNFHKKGVMSPSLEKIFFSCFLNWKKKKIERNKLENINKWLKPWNVTTRYYEILVPSPNYRGKIIQLKKFLLFLQIFFPN